MYSHVLTFNDADHEVSPLSDDAVHVYNPESEICKSNELNYCIICSWNNNCELIDDDLLSIFNEPLWT